MSVEELLASSGDAELLSYQYANTILVLHMRLDEPEQEVSVQIRTHKLQVSERLFAPDTFESRLGRAELVPIQLTVTNGYYVAPNDFIQLMKDVRSGQSLAYGSNASATKYLFSLVGYGRPMACLVSGPEQISISITNGS